jgi:hypothetical protein
MSFRDGQVTGKIQKYKMRGAMRGELGLEEIETA